MRTVFDNPLCGVIGDNLCSAILTPILLEGENEAHLQDLFRNWDIEDLKRQISQELHFILSRIKPLDGNLFNNASQTMVQWDISNIVRQSWLILIYLQKAGILPNTNDEIQMQQMHADILGVSVEVLKTLPFKSPLQLALERLMRDE